MTVGRLPGGQRSVREIRPDADNVRRPNVAVGRKEKRPVNQISNAY